MNPARRDLLADTVGEVIALVVVVVPAYIALSTFTRNLRARAVSWRLAGNPRPIGLDQADFTPAPAPAPHLSTDDPGKEPAA